MPAHWTPEQLEYMAEQWGYMSIPGIAKKLGRSTGAVREMAVKKKLGRHIHSGDYMTLNQLFMALGLRYVYTSTRLIRDGLPVKEKKSLGMPYRIINIDDFWDWLERNKMLVSIHNLEPYALGKEPEWVKQKRGADIAAYRYRRRRPWTPGEDQLLKTLLSTYRYGYRDISVRLVRGEAGIKRRILDLGLKTWPLAEPKNQKPWSERDIAILTEMYYIGHISEVIAEKIPRSASAIRGKIENMIRAGELDKNRYRGGDTNGEAKKTGNVTTADTQRRAADGEGIPAVERLVCNPASGGAVVT